MGGQFGFRLTLGDSCNFIYRDVGSRDDMLLGPDSATTFEFFLGAGRLEAEGSAGPFGHLTKIPRMTD